MAKKKSKSKSELVGFLGVGLDNKDDEHRLTRSEHFILVGGSPETHEKMQNTAIRFGENLRRRGKTLKETSIDEALELFHDSQDV